MNKRQKKKLGDKLLFRVRKLHPKKDDIVLLEFDQNLVGIDVAVKYFEALSDAYNISCLALLPNGLTLKQMDKDIALKYINKVKEKINEDFN